MPTPVDLLLDPLTWTLLAMFTGLGVWEALAPGRDLPTTEPGGGWGLVNGTTYAVAQVSGLVALAGERGSRPLASSLVRASDGKVAACATVLGKAARCP